MFRPRPLANIALRTGKESSVAVVDIDPRDGGDIALEQLIEQNGPLPETLEEKTGGGGRHLFFKYPESGFRCSTSTIGLGIDTKGDGGYVVISPSLHISGGQYTWPITEDPSEPTSHFDPLFGLPPLADLPDWLNPDRAAMPAIDTSGGTKMSYTAGKGKATGAPTVEGGRNSDLASLIGGWIRDGLTVVETYLKAVDKNNTNLPPLPDQEVIEEVVKLHRTHMKKNLEAIVIWGPTGEVMAKNVSLGHGVAKIKAELAAQKTTEAAKGGPSVSVPDSGFDPPIPLDEEVPPEMPADIFNGWVGEMIEEVSKSIETPRELAATFALGVLAMAAQGRFTVKTKSDHSEPLCFWLACGLDAGNRKSAVMSRMSKPLVDWEIEQREGFKSTISEWSAKERIRTSRLKELTRQAEKCTGETGDKAIKDELRKLESQQTSTPKAPRLLTEDCTSEGMSILLVDHNERMSVFSDEGSLVENWNGKYSKTGETSGLDIWLKGWSGSRSIQDRVGRQSVAIENPLISIAIAPQRSVIAKIVGTSNRLKWVAGRRVNLRLIRLVSTICFQSEDRRPAPVPIACLRRLVADPHTDRAVVRLDAFDGVAAQQANRRLSGVVGCPEWVERLDELPGANHG